MYLFEKFKIKTPENMDGRTPLTKERKDYVKRMFKKVNRKVTSINKFCSDMAEVVNSNPSTIYRLINPEAHERYKAKERANAKARRQRMTKADKKLKALSDTKNRKKRVKIARDILLFQNKISIKEYKESIIKSQNAGRPSNK